MKLLYTSDIHASDSHLFSMLSVVEAENIDGLIVGGDIIPHYLPDENTKGILRAQAIYLKNVFIPALKDLKKKRDVKMYLDLANYDFISNRTILEDHEETLFHLLHMKKCRLTDTIDIIGYMNVPPTPFSQPHLPGFLFAQPRFSRPSLSRLNKPTTVGKYFFTRHLISTDG